MKFRKSITLLLALSLAFTPVMVSPADFREHTITFKTELENKTGAFEGKKIKLSVDVKDKAGDVQEVFSIKVREK